MANVCNSLSLSLTLVWVGKFSMALKQTSDARVDRSLAEVNSRVGIKQSEWVGWISSWLASPREWYQTPCWTCLVRGLKTRALRQGKDQAKPNQHDEFLSECRLWVAGHPLPLGLLLSSNPRVELRAESWLALSGIWVKWETRAGSTNNIEEPVCQLPVSFQSLGLLFRSSDRQPQAGLHSARVEPSWEKATPLSSASERTQLEANWILD